MNTRRVDFAQATERAAPRVDVLGLSRRELRGLTVRVPDGAGVCRVADEQLDSSLRAGDHRLMSHGVSRGDHDVEIVGEADAAREQLEADLRGLDPPTHVVLLSPDALELGSLHTQPGVLE